MNHDEARDYLNARRRPRTAREAAQSLDLEAGHMKVWSGPRIVCLSRAQRPPIAWSDPPPEKDEAPDSAKVEGSKKGNLKGISAKSRLNLARLLSTLDWERLGVPLHVCLTYWLTWPKDKSALAVAKKAIRERMEDMGYCGLWRLEFQKRGAPHWHLILWVDDWDLAEARIRSWWARYSGNPHEAGVHVSHGREARAAWYIALHASKEAQAPKIEVGRWWGYVDRARVLSAVDVFEHSILSDRGRIWWARLYKRATGIRVRDNNGFSWFLTRQGQARVAAWVVGMCS